MNLSDNIKLSSNETFFTKTYYLIANGDLKAAESYLENIKVELPNHPLVSWLQALIEFGKGNYQEALKSLKQVIESHPKCPIAVRFGIGVCYYKLGNIKKARLAFLNVLKFDPQNSQASAGLAIVDMQLGKSSELTQEKKAAIAGLINQSYKSDRNNPLALKLIAEHHLKAGNHEIAAQLCDFALNILESYRRPDQLPKEHQTFRRGIEVLKSEFFFILGKIKHI